jgi:hypothetical protein
MRSDWAYSRAATPTAPLWETSAMFPGGGISREKLAFNETWESVLMIPRQFGPSRGMPLCRAAFKTSASLPIPSPPNSLKPAVMTMAPLIPFCPHSFSTWATAALGTIITARSTGSGISRTVGYALTPIMDLALEFTG